MSEPIRVYSVLSDPFRYGFMVMARTVLAQNPERDISFRILWHREYSPLSAEHQAWLAAGVPRLEFVEVDLSTYDGIFRLRDRLFKTPRRLFAAFLILEAFRDDGPGQVLCLDSDMICVGPFDEDLFEGDDFKAVEARKPKGEPLGYYNTGVMRIGRAHRGAEAYARIMSFDDVSKYQKKTGAADQALLAMMYRPTNSTALPWRYNVTRRHVPRKEVVEHLRGMSAVFLHYVGAKPWHVSIDHRDLGHSDAERLWDRTVRQYLTAEEHVAYLEEWRDISREHVRSYLKANPPIKALTLFRKARKRLVKILRRKSRKKPAD